VLVPELVRAGPRRDDGGVGALHAGGSAAQYVGQELLITRPQVVADSLGKRGHMGFRNIVIPNQMIEHLI
jgi:hypothetical protein